VCVSVRVRECVWFWVVYIACSEQRQPIRDDKVEERRLFDLAFWVCVCVCVFVCVCV
jgi:hypothetical protein